MAEEISAPEAEREPAAEPEVVVGGEINTSAASEEEPGPRPLGFSRGLRHENQPPVNRRPGPNYNPTFYY